MPRIPYADIASIDDPEVLAALDRARRVGTPRPESQAIRANVPAVIKTFTHAWMDTFVNGVLEHELKELCRVYVTKTVQCGYCAAQRSEDAAVSEDKYDDLLDYASSGTYTEREKAALAYTDAIAWDAALATDEVWERLHRHFTAPELTELGFFIGLTLGQQRWLKTLDLSHGEVMADTDAGLVATSDA
jgi:alkylhydroperoxidase family enzyme